MIRLNRRTPLTRVDANTAQTSDRVGIIQGMSKPTVIPGTGQSQLRFNQHATLRDGSGTPTEEFEAVSAAGWMGTPYNNTVVSTLPINVDLGTLLDDIGHDYFAMKSDKLLYRLYRDMYFYDNVAGSAVDMQSALPFSDFSLGGIHDLEILKVYNHTIERLNLKTLLSEVSVDYMVLGAFISSLLYDRNSSTFSDLMPHPIENVDITALPFYSQAPVIEVAFSQRLIKVLSNTASPRIKALRAKFGEAVINKILKGKLELDPLSTIYMPRRTFSHVEGTSYYKRILPVYLLEKNLFRGTLLESSRRQRGILHLTVGDGDGWEPTPDDLNYISELFVNASCDPLGSIIATRLGVSTEEVLCVAGSTLISTDLGKVPIAGLVEHDPETLKPGTALPIDVQVIGVNNTWAVADTWLYQGKQPVYRMQAESGAYLDCTTAHRVLALMLDGSLQTVPASTVWSQGLRVAIHPNLDDGYTTSHLELPAYLLGLVLTQNATSVLTSTSTDVLYHANLAVKTLYNTTGVLQAIPHSPKYRLVFEDTVLESLSLLVPDSTTRRSYLRSFFAGVLDSCCDDPCSSWRVPGTTSFINDLKSLANSMGYSVVVNPQATLLQIAQESKPGFYRELYSCLQHSDNRKHHAEFFGPDPVPSRFVRELVKHRQASYLGNDMFRNDQGDMVLATGLFDEFNEVLEENEPFDRQAYRQGKYDRLFQRLKVVSMDCYKHVCQLFDCSFRFEQIVSFEPLGEQPVYDISIHQPNDPTLFYNDRAYREGKTATVSPLYLANSTFISKNSGGEFWKWTDVVEETTAMKYKGLGINESLLSGEATLNTMDNSLTLFIDHLRNYRDMITRKFFYNSIFPLIAVINGYLLDGKGKVSKSDSLLKANLEDTLAIIQDGSKLLIPTVQWSKQLKPEGDSSYMDILDRMTQAGVPIPLRVIAAAGGFNIHELLAQKKDDLAMRKQVGEYLKELGDLTKKFQEGGHEEGQDQSNFSGYASDQNLLAALASDNEGVCRGASSVLSGNQQPCLLDRFSEQDGEVISRTRTGKKKYVFRQKAAQDKANHAIIKALRSHRKHGASQLTHNTTTTRKPE